MLNPSETHKDTMDHPIQQELFSPEQYTRTCSRCRREFPRTQAFFPEGRAKDGMASVCRQCTRFRRSPKNGESPVLDEITLLERKACEDCGKLKELTEFYMDSHTTDGKSRWCKDCSNARYEARQERRRRLGEDAWAVFFIQDTRNLRVKIGCSADPHESFSSLQQASSVVLKLLAVMEAKSRSDAESRERELHRLFEGCYEGHGWFECVTVLQQYIALIQQEELPRQSTPLNQPPMRTRSRRIQQHPGAVRVEGQIFPNLTAASAATGYTPEQIEVLGGEPELPFATVSEDRS